MKKTFVLISFILLLCGCNLNMSMTERISSLETRFEQMDLLSEEEVSELVKEYNRAVSKFMESEEKYTEEEKSCIHHSMGVINGVLMKKKMAELETRFEHIDLMSEDEASLLVEEYKTVVSQFKEEGAYYSDKEKDAIYQSIGKINGILTRRGVNSSLNGIEEFVKSIPSIVEGFMDGLSKDNVSNKDTLENMMQS